MMKMVDIPYFKPDLCHRGTQKKPIVALLHNMELLMAWKDLY